MDNEEKEEEEISIIIGEAQCSVLTVSGVMTSLAEAPRYLYP